jgi:hypothetical protein
MVSDTVPKPTEISELGKSILFVFQIPQPKLSIPKIIQFSLQTQQNDNLLSGNVLIYYLIVVGSRNHQISNH